MKKSRKVFGLEVLAGNSRRSLERATAAGEIPDREIEETASLFKLKMHVDNPGQTPM